MAIIVAVASQKGGVGKSTVARLIAREYAAGEWEVKVADLDPKQGTSTDWARDREAAGVSPGVSVEPYRSVGVALSKGERYDLLVLDGRPDSTQATLEMAVAADLIILPTGLALDDLRPTIRLAHELVKKKVPASKIGFVLNHVGDSGAEIEDARGYIEEAGYEVLPGSLPEKTAYRRAADEGKTLVEVSYPSLRKRAQEVVDGIVAKITQSQEEK